MSLTRADLAAIRAIVREELRALAKERLVRRSLQCGRGSSPPEGRR